MTETAYTGASAPSSRAVIGIRLVAAALQAVALLVLTQAASSSPVRWPATEPLVFDPLLSASVFVPLILMAGCSQLGRRPLAIWSIVAAVAVMTLGYHHAAREKLADGSYGSLRIVSVWETIPFWLIVSAALFVAHVCVVDAVTERRFMPAYKRHFDTAWMLGLQAALSVGFVGVFWAILELGAALFRLVDIDVFSRLLRHDWFYFPATTLALALAIHATDAQPALIRGARSIVLTLFSWLLPLLVVILATFLGSLPFISLRPLWSTHFATGLLLTAAGLLIFLINCCYQDGQGSVQVGKLKRASGSAGAILLLPLTGLAGWALGLRVEEYGWTVERINAAAIIILFLCYTLGYASASIRPKPWLQGVESTNFLAAGVFVALTAALCSPVADPARLMVASQMAALESGKIPADKFDFSAIRFDGARWGHAALQALAARQDAASASIASDAKAALGLTNRFGAPAPHSREVTMFPPGSTLPPGFGEAQIPVQCEWEKCVGHRLALKPGAPESLLVVGLFVGEVFDTDSHGEWHQSYSLQGNFSCAGFRDALQAGTFAPVPHDVPDIAIGGQTFSLTPIRNGC